MSEELDEMIHEAVPVMDDEVEYNKMCVRCPRPGNGTLSYENMDSISSVVDRRLVDRRPIFQEFDLEMDRIVGHLRSPFRPGI